MNHQIIRWILYTGRIMNYKKIFNHTAYGIQKIFETAI